MCLGDIKMSIKLDAYEKDQDSRQQQKIDRSGKSWQCGNVNFVTENDS